MVYFVLYVVLITELLIVITERDELEEEEHKIRDKMLSQIAESYIREIELSIPQRKSEVATAEKNSDFYSVVFNPIGLVSEEEKASVEYFVKLAPESKAPPNWVGGELNINNGNEFFRLVRSNGTGEFKMKITGEGDYKFLAYCKVERSLPTYLTEKLREELKHTIEKLKVANNMDASALTSRSKNEDFLVIVKRQGGVQRAQVTFD